MKRTVSFLCVLLLLSLSALPVCGAGVYDEHYDYSAPDSRGLQIIDEAQLLTASEEEALLQKLLPIREKYSFDIVLLTVNSIGGKSVQDFADDYYDYNGYGLGTERDGLLFMLNMNNGAQDNRDYYTSTCGFGIVALTDYAIGDSSSEINRAILPLLREGDYYGAFDKYLSLVDVFLEQAKSGKPYDTTNRYKSVSDILQAEAVLLLAAVGIALAVVFLLKGKSKTNVVKHTAADYVVPGSLQVTGGYERFVGRNVAKTPRQTSSSGGSGGGSSTHRSSGGSAHGGGGGKF